MFWRISKLMHLFWSQSYKKIGSSTTKFVENYLPMSFINCDLNIKYAFKVTEKKVYIKYDHFTMTCCFIGLTLFRAHTRSFKIWFSSKPKKINKKIVSYMGSTFLRTWLLTNGKYPSEYEFNLQTLKESSINDVTHILICLALYTLSYFNELCYVICCHKKCTSSP